MTTHTLSDTGVLTGRSLRHILRSPDTIITTAVTPVALMLLFTFVLGGAINTGATGSYIDYLLPGILLITVASGVASSWSAASGVASCSSVASGAESSGSAASGVA